MKKYLSLLLILLLLVSGCSNGKTEVDNNQNNNEVSDDADKNNQSNTETPNEVGNKTPINNGVICKRATELHTEICNYSNSGGSTWTCLSAGYNKGDTITYGSLGTEGKLTSGDAFDCDVNGDGMVDSKTERFYYVSDYYNTSTNSFDKDVAVLIYYSNTSSGEVDNVTENNYNDTYEVWNGPLSAMRALPTTNQWSNIKLVNNVRTIRNEKNGTTLDDFPKSNAGDPTYKSYNLPSAYSYSGYAARLLTYQELVKACDMDLEELAELRSLDKCSYLLENTNHANKEMVSQYWLETPKYDGNYVGEISTLNASFGFRSLGTSGVRPVIEIPKDSMEY